MLDCIVINGRTLRKRKIPQDLLYNVETPYDTEPKPNRYDILKEHSYFRSDMKKCYRWPKKKRASNISNDTLLASNTDYVYDYSSLSDHSEDSIMSNAEEDVNAEGGTQVKSLASILKAEYERELKRKSRGNKIRSLKPSITESTSRVNEEKQIELSKIRPKSNSVILSTQKRSSTSQDIASSLSTVSNSTTAVENHETIPLNNENINEFKIKETLDTNVVVKNVFTCDDSLFLDLLNEKTKNELTAEQQNDLLDTDKFNENNKSSGHNPISLSENIIINNVSPLPENVYQGTSRVDEENKVESLSTVNNNTTDVKKSRNITLKNQKINALELKIFSIKNDVDNIFTCDDLLLNEFLDIENKKDSTKGSQNDSLSTDKFIKKNEFSENNPISLNGNPIIQNVSLLPENVYQGSTSRVGKMIKIEPSEKSPEKKLSCVLRSRQKCSSVSLGYASSSNVVNNNTTAVKKRKNVNLKNQNINGMNLNPISLNGNPTIQNVSLLPENVIQGSTLRVGKKIKIEPSEKSPELVRNYMLRSHQKRSSVSQDYASSSSVVSNIATDVKKRKKIDLKTQNINEFKLQNNSINYNGDDNIITAHDLLLNDSLNKKIKKVSTKKSQNGLLDTDELLEDNKSSKFKRIPLKKKRIYPSLLPENVAAPFQWYEIIYLAMKHSTREYITCHEIQDFTRKWFPFYNNASWIDTIFTTLNNYNKKYFVKYSFAIDSDDLWAVNVKSVKYLEDSMLSIVVQYGNAIKTAMKNPEKYQLLINGYGIDYLGTTVLHKHQMPLIRIRFNSTFVKNTIE